MTEAEIALVSGAITDVLRAYSKKHVDPLVADISEIKKLFDELPAPKNGDPGKPGKDAEPVDYERISNEIKTGIVAAVAEIPRPVDGKDVDPAVVQELVAAEVVRAVGAIAPAKDGKDVDPVVVEEIRSDIAALKANDVASTAVDMARQVAAAVAKAEEKIESLELLPKSPSSFVVDDAGELVAVYPDGTTKTVGMVRGKDGIRGASIMDGSVDDSGQLVLRMSDGRIINAGAVRGKDGADAVGKPGLPGRDANEVRILPAIDESKSYPEGTTALYRGGMIRAERTTEPISGDLAAAGWRVALEGIADESEQELDDGRIIERTTIYTSGRTFIRQRSSRALIYRGTWKDGEFARGDTVTWDGSLWHCERETKARPGGLDNNGDWKLCAKRGAPGKDGQSIKGDPGDPGRAGRDLTQLGPNGAKY